MRDSLKWSQLKGLHQLYKERKTLLKLMNNSYIKDILHSEMFLLDYKPGNRKILIPLDGYNKFYKEHLEEQYKYYSNFFTETRMDNSALKNYDTYDVETLLFIFHNSNELRSKLTTARIFSSNVFKKKDSKYLENKPGLLKDVLFLLKVDTFPAQSPKENQWRIQIDCIEPKYVLLCENMDFLKVPWPFKDSHIELWYVGGNNTKILNEIADRNLQLPIFYICDWDYAGLKIYTNIKKIFRRKKVDIRLILPKKPILKPINSGNHKSKWRSEEFSKLNRSQFNSDEINLIQKLIDTNQWVEEQTISPIKELKKMTRF